MYENLDNAKRMKFCKHCGSVIDMDCVVCPECGKQVEELKQAEQSNIIINNSSSASAAAAATNSTKTRVKKKYNTLLDIVLIFCTCGLWLIWMALRPKYEYV